MVASDRISAYDYVLPTPIPDKGEVLTALTLWWFEQLADLVPNHLVARRRPGDPGRVARPGDAVPPAGDGAGRVRRPRLPGRVGLAVLPGDRRGVRRGAAARAGRRLPAAGADLHAGDQGGGRRARRERSPTRTVGRRSGRSGRPSCGSSRWRSTGAAAGLAAGRGILVADTKLEFGLDAERRADLGDEVLTPDSSRFWPADRGGRAGRSRRSTSSTCATGCPRGWDRQGAAAAAAGRGRRATRARYVEAYERLTGPAFADWPGA